MKKITFLSLMAVLLVIIAITALVRVSSFETDDPSSDNKMWTKAICNEENYCIDIQITCEGNNVIDIKPVPDGIYFSEEFEDPRPEEFRNKWC